MAQTTDVVTGLSSPRGLAFHGNELYIAEFGANRISKIDVTDPNPVVTEVVPGINGPYALDFKDNLLFITERNGNNRILQTNITANPPALTTIVSTLDPLGVVFFGGFLYVSQLDDKIRRIDLTDGSITTILSNLHDPVGLAFYMGELYFTDWGANRLAKTTPSQSMPTATQVVGGLISPTFSALDGTELYVTEFGANRISKIDLSDPNPAATEVVSISDHPRGLAVRGNELYIASGSKIVKFDLSTLSVDQAVPTKALSLYPNPTSGSIEVSGLAKREPYKIYNLLGTELQSGTVANQEKINVGQLNTGVYFLRLESGKTFKFVKE